jgi:hypothetical protein
MFAIAVLLIRRHHVRVRARCFPASLIAAVAVLCIMATAAQASRPPTRTERSNISRVGNVIARLECHRNSVSQRIRVSTVNNRWAVTRFRCGVQEYTILLLHGRHGWSEFEQGAGPEVWARVPYPIMKDLGNPESPLLESERAKVEAKEERRRKIEAETPFMEEPLAVENCHAYPMVEASADGSIILWEWVAGSKVRDTAGALEVECQEIEIGGPYGAKATGNVVWVKVKMLQ